MILNAFLGLAAVATQGAASPAPVQDRIFTLSGYVSSRDEKGDAWFRLAGHEARLMLPSGAERETFWLLLEAAEERNVTFHVRVDAAAGRLVGESRRLVYPVCSIRTPTGASFGDEARNCPPRAPPEAESERLLALALAQVDEHPEQARRLLSEALAASPELPLLARAVAYKERAELTEFLSLDLAPGEAQDRLLADALADRRRLADLLPDRAGPQLALANAFSALGAYEEAEEVLRETGRRWPDEAFNVAVDLGALFRQQGNYRRALDMLDDYARRNPGVDGMRYHYHRAWTLMLLGRNEEALRSVDAGLVSQPDYGSAYGLRSCLLSRLGRLDEALADQERAIELYGLMIGQGAYSRVVIERSRSAAAALREAVAAGRRGPVSAPCWELLRLWSRPRSRSPLIANHASD